MPPDTPEVHAAFVIPYARISYPWAEYPEALHNEEHRRLCVPRLLMIQRDDGSFGFPGGHVEETDGSATAAVVREAWEEAALRLNPARLVHLHTRISAKGNPIAIFSQHFEYETLAQTAANYRSASHAAEVAGIILPHLINYKHPRQIPRFADLRISRLPFTDRKTKEDVKILLDRQGLTRDC